MADEEKSTEEVSFISGIVHEIINSPLNLALIAVITFLIFKIFKSRQAPKPSPPSEPELPKIRKDFTVAELKAFDGNQPDGRVLVAVNGSVYDVTRGKRFYGPGEFTCCNGAAPSCIFILFSRFRLNWCSLTSNLFLASLHSLSLLSVSLFFLLFSLHDVYVQLSIPVPKSSRMLVCASLCVLMWVTRLQLAASTVVLVGWTFQFLLLRQDSINKTSRTPTIYSQWSNDSNSDFCLHKMNR